MPMHYVSVRKTVISVHNPSHYADTVLSGATQFSNSDTVTAIPACNPRTKKCKHGSFQGITSIIHIYKGFVFPRPYDTL